MSLLARQIHMLALTVRIRPNKASLRLHRRLQYFPRPLFPSPFHQPSEVRMAIPAPDDHYLDPRYDPGPSPPSTRYKLKDEGVAPHDD